MIVVCQIVNLYVLVVLASIILSWFRVPGDHPVASVQRGVGRLVDPLLRPLRSAIPPLRVGGVGLDLSPIILIIAVRIVARLIGC